MKVCSRAGPCERAVAEADLRIELVGTTRERALADAQRADLGVEVLAERLRNRVERRRERDPTEGSGDAVREQLRGARRARRSRRRSGRTDCRAGPPPDRRSRTRSAARVAVLLRGCGGRAHASIAIARSASCVPCTSAKRNVRRGAGDVRDRVEHVDVERPLEHAEIAAHPDREAAVLGLDPLAHVVREVGR